MEISREFHAHSGNYKSGGNSCRYIVVHNTGNTASARNEASYAQNNHHQSSYHYVLDGSECYQILDDTDTAWAVGAWSGCTAYIKNNQSISIEVVANDTEFTSEEQSMLRELVLSLMEKHDIGADHVVRHYDCHSGRKNCPGFYAGDGNSAWDALHAYITNGTAEAPVISQPASQSSSNSNSSGGLSVDGIIGAGSTKAWQRAMGTTADGIISGQAQSLQKYFTAIRTCHWGSSGSQLIKAVQRQLGCSVDGKLGPNTVKAIQRHLGVTADGYFGPNSAKALQRRLNEGYF